jgi:ketosteroid isomerase-like protein
MTTTMNENQSLKLIQEFLDAWGRADVDKLMTIMSDDCVYLASLGPEPGKTYSGRENLRQGFTEMTTTETELETREGRIWVSGDHAFAEWSYDETGDDGLVVEIRGLDVIHIVEGKIKSIDAYRKTT